MPRSSPPTSQVVPTWRKTRKRITPERLSLRYSTALVGSKSAVTMAAAARAGGAAIDVRIDLFADASADEAAAVAAWIGWRGGTVGWRGPTALTATLPADQIGPASRLSPIRWVE